MLANDEQRERIAMANQFHMTFISLFHKPVKDPASKDRDLTLSQFITMIRDGTWKPLIDWLRSLTDQTDYRKAKDLLPGATPAGRFSHASNRGFEEPSGLGQVDLPAVLQRGQEPAFGEIERVVAGGGHRVDTHPFQLVQVVGV